MNWSVPTPRSWTPPEEKYPNHPQPVMKEWQDICQNYRTAREYDDQKTLARLNLRCGIRDDGSATVGKPSRWVKPRGRPVYLWATPSTRNTEGPASQQALSHVNSNSGRQYHAQQEAGPCREPLVPPNVPTSRRSHHSSPRQVGHAVSLSTGSGQINNDRRSNLPTGFLDGSQLPGTGMGSGSQGRQPMSRSMIRRRRRERQQQRLIKQQQKQQQSRRHDQPRPPLENIAQQHHHQPSQQGRTQAHQQNNASSSIPHLSYHGNSGSNSNDSSNSNNKHSGRQRYVRGEGQ
ncbi:hypothetical protein F66182_8128 [Fusarium sp. NRRL 66182]|nr:hypothetical protein F66182_8128 [Fusarium sp. NRRL 66182]